jgi:hypothetical protein
MKSLTLEKAIQLVAEKEAICKNCPHPTCYGVRYFILDVLLNNIKADTNPLDWMKMSVDSCNTDGDCATCPNHQWNNMPELQSIVQVLSAQLVENKEYVDIILKHDKQCTVCNYSCDCHGVSCGPNGPYYPACADIEGDYESIFDTDYAIETALELLIEK